MFNDARALLTTFVLLTPVALSPIVGCAADGSSRGDGSGAASAGGAGLGGGSGVGGSGNEGGSAATGGHGGGGDVGGAGAGTAQGGSGTGGGGGGSVEPCPDGIVCVTSFPFEHDGTTTGAASDTLDGYSCAPTTNESGPEVIYRVDLPADGFLALEIQEPLGVGVDIDVHLLQSLDADTCIDRGHWRAGALLEAGRYWVTADTWVSGGGEAADGAYTLTFGLTTVADLTALGMDAGVASDALFAFDTAWAADEALHFGYAVTDFSLRSDTRRMWVIDLATGSLVQNTFCPHGELSSSPTDSRWAVSFSNQPESHKSSLGVMRGAETYTGSFGYSMRLDGLEPGYNDNVRSRAIVVHPWDGSTPSYVASHGECAPTWGCAGLDPGICDDVVDFLSNGGLLLFHYPDGDWSAHSDYLH